MTYVTEYATSARSSRVTARPHSYTQITPVTELGVDDRPSFVHLDPTGQHVVVRDANGLHLVDAKQRMGPGSFRGIAYVTEWGAILGRWEMRWDGKTLDGRDDHTESPPTFPVDIAQGYQLAARWSAERWTSVGQQLGAFDVRTVVAIRSRAGDDDWVSVIPGFGSAAIGEDGRVIVGMTDGQLRVYAPHGDAGDGMRGSPRSEIAVGEAVHAVSAIGSGAGVLSERSGATGVRFVDDRVVWSTEVAFTSRQPAIDGGDGRVYVAGDGLAALDRGVIAWSTPSVVPARATAFADGTLAVCRGPGLQIIARDGSIVQQLTTSDGATIVTPPAIGPDGSIWLATASHLCVAR